MGSIKDRNPASVRLSETQYQEMERLGFSNASAYLRYLLQKENTKMGVVPPSTEEKQGNPLSALPRVSGPAPLEDKLTIQRLSMENRKLQEKLEEVQHHNRETLNGVDMRVHSLLQEELRKRDFEALKKDYAMRSDQVQQLEKSLEETKKELHAKQEEIEALVKKLGLVELGKALLPGAISGLARQYPKQMKGIAGTLGSLGLGPQEQHPNNSDAEDTQHLVQIVEYLKEVFSEEQFEQALQLLLQIGEQIQSDTGLIQKIEYYLKQLAKTAPPVKEQQSKEQ